MLRTALNGWTIAHGLHVDTIPMCVEGGVKGEADTLAHYVVCRRVRVEIEAVVSLPSRDFSLS